MKTLEYSEEDYAELVEEAEEETFNVYQGMKDELVSMGIPADQVAFIHDYSSDKAKGDLFQKVRDGEIRVVIGSTAKLGTGVNVQDRIVALHHLDVPWKPADQEQRDGRGIRRGNYITEQFYNNELPVYYYATEMTVDAYKYQLLDTKDKFIKQAKSSSDVREITEGDGDEENGVSYAAFVAMLSGNPAILEKSKAEKKVKELKQARDNFADEKYRIQDNIKSDENWIEKNNRAIESHKKIGEIFDANTTRDENGEYVFDVVIQGERFTKRKEAGEKLKDIMRQWLFDYYGKYPPSRYVYSVNMPKHKMVVGSSAGFELSIESDLVLGMFRDNKNEVEPKIVVSNPEVGDVLSTNSDTEMGIAQAIFTQIRKKSDSEREVSDNKYRKTQIEEYKKLLDSMPEEFDRENELKEAEERLEKVNNLLRDMASQGDLPAIEELESSGKRLNRNVFKYSAESYDLKDIYQVNSGIVSKVKSFEDALLEPESTIFYEYKNDTPVNDGKIRSGDLVYPAHNSDEFISVVKAKNVKTNEYVYVARIMQELDYNKEYSPIVKPLITQFNGEWNKSTQNIVFNTKDQAGAFKKAIETEFDVENPSEIDDSITDREGTKYQKTQEQQKTVAKQVLDTVLGKLKKHSLMYK